MCWQSTILSVHWSILLQYISYVKYTLIKGSKITQWIGWTCLSMCNPEFCSVVYFFIVSFIFLSFALFMFLWLLFLSSSLPFLLSFSHFFLSCFTFSPFSSSPSAALFGFSASSSASSSPNTTTTYFASSSTSSSFLLLLLLLILPIPLCCDLLSVFWNWILVHLFVWSSLRKATVLLIITQEIYYQLMPSLYFPPFLIYLYE